MKIKSYVAWPVPCDADGDGDFDLIVSCPDKPSNGVWLFENAVGDTAKNKFPVFKPARRLSKTVHYVMPSYVDGKLRVLTPGAEYLNFEKAGLEQRVALPVPANFYKPEGKQPKGPKVRHNQWRYADYDGDGSLDLITGIEDWSYYGWDDAWNSQGEWTNGPLHGFVLVHRNTGTTESAKYIAPTKVEADGKPVDTFGCPSPNFADFDGHGDLDLIVGDEDGRVAFVENIGVARTPNAATPRFATPRYFQQKADTLKCGALATPCGFDWDNDGDVDIVSGNTAGYIEFFENLSGPRTAQPKWATPKRLEADGKVFRVLAGPNGSLQGPAEAKWGYTTLNVADWDADGLPDIVLNSILGRVQWLKNVGTRTAPKLAAAQPIEVEWVGSTPKPAWTWWNPEGKQLITQWRTTPVVHDFNGDGLLDLAMLDVEGFFVFFERTRRDGRLILLPPQRVYTDASGKPLRFNERTAGGSGRRKLSVVDWDGDGQLDLLLNSANADLYRGLGMKNGQWQFQHAGTLARQNIEGHDVSPTTVDFDGNGISDFLGGAEDGRFYFLKNPRSP